MSLKHESEVSENGQPRRISLEIKALAIGEITARLSAAALGSSGQFGGFLAAMRNGRGIRFHITAVDLDV
jgi:primosomal replication protein N